MPEIVNSMAEKNRLLSHAQLARLRREIVGDGLVRLVEWPAR